MGSTVNVLYATSNDRAVEAAERMHRSHGWRPVYWLATTYAAPSIRQRFPEVPIHDYLSSVKGVGHPEFRAGATGDVDMAFFHASSTELWNALYMLERNDSFAGDMGVKDRIEFLYELSAYWLGVLRRLRPGLVVFEEEPHQASDYILYLLSRHFDIRVLVPMRTMPDWGFLLSDGFEEGPIIAPETSPGLAPLPDYIAKYVRSLRGNYADAKPLMLWDQPDRDSSLRAAVDRRVEKIAATAGRTRAYLRNFREFQSDQKERGKSLQKSELPYVTYLMRKWITLRTKRRNRRIYDALTERHDFSKPFVYFALNYQPEKTTAPCGGDFVHQLLVVRLLSNALPEGWRLVVKEHPSQFRPEYSRYGESFRSVEYYERIKSFRNVVLAPMSEDPYTLIDKAEAVACVGGSACFEAVLRTKRSLLFGDTWYMGCPGIDRIHGSDDIRAALARPRLEAEVQEEAVHRYLTRVSQSLYRSAVALGDRKLFDANIGLEEYSRSYLDFHSRFIAPTVAVSSAS